MSFTVSAKRNDRESRRLLERLSGWRLVAFLVVMSANLITLVLLSVLVLAPNPRWQTLLAGLVSSHSALFATGLGAFGFRIQTKLLLGCLHWAICVYAICQFSSLPFFGDAFTQAFLVLGAQSLLICGSFTLYGYWRQKRCLLRVRDLFAITAVFAVGMQAIQFLIPGWKLIGETDVQSTVKCIHIAGVNTFWCIALVFIFVRNLPPTMPMNSDWRAHLVRSALILLLALILELSIPTSGLPAILSRIVFAGWLGVSFLPVLGLSADPGSIRWVTTAEFYRLQQRGRAVAASTQDAAYSYRS